MPAATLVLGLGDVVVNTDPADMASRSQRELPPQRGQVIWAGGRGIKVGTPLGLTTFIIRTGPGQTHHEDAPAFWDKVPESQWTFAEKATRAQLLYEVPPWADEGGLSDLDTEEWQMLVELLPDSQRQAVKKGNAPSLLELILMVAGHIDELNRRGCRLT